MSLKLPDFDSILEHVMESSKDEIIIENSDDKKTTEDKPEDYDKEINKSPKKEKTPKLKISEKPKEPSFNESSFMRNIDEKFSNVDNRLRQVSEMAARGAGASGNGSGGTGVGPREVEMIVNQILSSGGGASGSGNPVTGNSFDNATRTHTVTLQDGTEFDVVIPDDGNPVTGNSFDNATRTQTLTLQDGTEFDVVIPSSVDNLGFDEPTRTLTLNLVDGSSVNVVIPSGNVEVTSVQFDSSTRIFTVTDSEGATFDTAPVDIFIETLTYDSATRQLSANRFDGTSLDVVVNEEIVESTSDLTGTAPDGAKYGVNTATGTIFFVDGSDDWQPVPLVTVDLNLTVSDETGSDAGATPVTPPSDPDDGDVHQEIYDDFTVYYTYTAGSFVETARVPSRRDLATVVSPASDDDAGAVGSSELAAREDHKHPAQAPSADADNIIQTGTDGLHFVDPSAVENFVTTDLVSTEDRNHTFNHILEIGGVANKSIQTGNNGFFSNGQTAFIRSESTGPANGSGVFANGTGEVIIGSTTGTYLFEFDNTVQLPTESAAEPNLRPLVVDEDTGAILRGSGPFVNNITSLTDWAGPVSSVYEIVVPQATHGITDPLTVQVWEVDSSGLYTQVRPETVSIDSDGDIRVAVTATPDSRFLGRIIIQ